MGPEKTSELGSCLLLLLLVLCLPLFLGVELGLLLRLSLALVFASLITHVCFSWIEGECLSHTVRVGLRGDDGSWSLELARAQRVDSAKLI